MVLGLTKVLVEAYVLPPHSLVESKPIPIHPRLCLMPNVERRVQLLHIILLPLHFGKGYYVSCIRIYDLGERSVSTAMIRSSTLYRKRNIVQSRLVKSYASLKVGGLLVVAEGEDLIDLLVFEGAEFNVD